MQQCEGLILAVGLLCDLKIPALSTTNHRTMYEVFCKVAMESIAWVLHRTTFYRHLGVQEEGREGMGYKKENGFSTVPPSDCPIARTKTRDSLAASDTRKETLEARDLNPR